MEYGAKKTVARLFVLGTCALSPSLALAEQHSSGFGGFGFGAPESAPAPVNDGRSLSLPSPSPKLPSPQALAPRDDFRVTGASVGGRVSTDSGSTSLTSSFGDGYNAPVANRAPVVIVPYGERIGLSRVPRSALSPPRPLAIQ